MIYRKKNEITNEPKAGIIIQRMINAELSAQTFSDDEEIIVKAFIGYQDFDNEFEKDIMVFSKGSLDIKNSKINYQEHGFTRDLRDNTLIKKALRNEGEKQKLNDKEAEEIARITKRVESFLEKPIKIFFNISKQKPYLLFANKVIRKKSEEAEEIFVEQNNIEENKNFPVHERVVLSRFYFT